MAPTYGRVDDKPAPNTKITARDTAAAARVETPCLTGANGVESRASTPDTQVVCPRASTPPSYTAGAARADVPDANQLAAIIVNGRKLTGPNSQARRRDGVLLIPITSVANSLGDAVSVDTATRTISVRRQTGMVSDFDGRRGIVRENGLDVLLVSNAGKIIFSPSGDGLYLPAELAATLFDVSIRYETEKNTVIITRGQAQTQPSITRSTQSRLAALYQVDYDFSLNRYSSASAGNLLLTAYGRLADGRFQFTSNSDSTARRKVQMRNVTFSLDRPNGQRFMGGDFGVGSNLQFLSSSIRGGSASVPFRQTVITAFLGRSISGLYLPASEQSVPHDPKTSARGLSRYDTNIVGFYATTANRLSRRVTPLTFSAGALKFGGSQRSGSLITASANYDVTRFSLQGDIGFGSFKGTRPDFSRFSGTGLAADVAASFNVTENLTLHGRYSYIGKNFLSPQQGFREPADLKSAGVRWSPVKWLSFAVHGTATNRPGDARQNNKFVTAALSITPGLRLPTFFVSHTQSRTGQTGAGAFTLLNASKEFSRLRLFLNASRIQSLGVISINANLSANYIINDRNSFEISQGMGSRGARYGQFDWRTSNLLKQRLSLTAGMGYTYSPTTGYSWYQRLSASVKLPRHTSLQVNYYQTNAGPTILINLKGSLFRRKEAEGFLESPVGEMNSFGKISGRVYQDVNLNGRFDEGDKTQAGVKVRVDGNRYVESDANGLYRFESVTAGDHKVYLDLLSVRADLTLLGGVAKDATLGAGRESVLDFRLVRTGRISGMVWFDVNENGKFDDGEKPLADIRIVTAGGRDTLTDSDGKFVFADLPPGEHIILIDEKTLPEKTMAGSRPPAVQAFPGRETSDVGLGVIVIPPEIKRFGTKTAPPGQNR